MSFQELLEKRARDSLASEKVEREARIARKLEEKKLLKEEEKRYLAELESLEEMARKRFLPIFELINQRYIEGRGRIELIKSRFRNSWFSLSLRGELNIEQLLLSSETNVETVQLYNSPHVNIELVWDEGETKPKSGVYRRKRLELNLFSKQVILLGGNKSEFDELYPTIRFSPDDEDWEKKLEEGVYLIMTNPKHHTYHFGGESRPTYPLDFGRD